MSGWIKLHRQIMDNPYYFAEKFCKQMAWIDLILLANHADGLFYKRGIKVEVKRGQVGYDIDSLAKRWKWSRGKVNRWILELETVGQIVRQNNNVTTLITVVNYDTYQSDDKANDIPNSKPDGHQTVKQTDTNKNDKKNKEEKEYKYNSFYDEQILLSNNDERFLIFVKILFGENDLKTELKNILSLQSQVTYEQFKTIDARKTALNVNVHDVLLDMENCKELKKRYTSVQRTLINWMKTRKK